MNLDSVPPTQISPLMRGYDSCDNRRPRVDCLMDSRFYVEGGGKSHALDTKQVIFMQPVSQLVLRRMSTGRRSDQTKMSCRSRLLMLLRSDELRMTSSTAMMRPASTSK